VETEEWLGQWSRPGASSRVGGLLSFKEDGVTLNATHSLFDLSQLTTPSGVMGYPVSPPQEIPVLHGTAPKRLSVLDAWCDWPVVGGGMRGNETWHASAIVEGHVGSDDGGEPTFKGLQFELSNLPAWAGWRGIRRTEWFGDDARSDISVQAHDLAFGNLPGGGTIRIDQGRVLRWADREVDIRQPVRLSIEGVEAESWRALLNGWLQPIQVLLWIATAEVGRVEHLGLRLPTEEQHEPKWGRLWVSLLEPAERTGTTRHRDSLFFAAEMPGGFGAGVARWLGLWGELRHVLGPMFARSAAPFAYANDQFYSAISAVEAYHRYCVESERDLPRQQHKARVRRLKEVLEETAPDLAVWAVNAATPFNRVPLWSRIVQIAECLPLVSEALFDDRVEEFARAAESQRHGHAHALRSDAEADPASVLHHSARALTWLLRGAILVDLGFTPEVAEERILRHEGFRSDSRRCREMVAGLAQPDDAAIPEGADG
jgi:hypothetical protein